MSSTNWSENQISVHCQENGGKGLIDTIVEHTIQNLIKIAQSDFPNLFDKIQELFGNEEIGILFLCYKKIIIFFSLCILQFK